MDQVANIICPVCTLYLRPGITLENHLTSHPKQKVIEALIKVSQFPNFEKLIGNTSQGSNETNSFPPLPTSTPTWNIPTPINLPAMPPNVNQVPTNQSFIYQQFMSSSGTPPILNVNPMTQQFVAVPTVVNPQMFCSPYVFQQQQLQILSTNPNMQPMLQRAPVSLLNNEMITSSVSVSTETTSVPSPKTQIDTATITEPESPTKKDEENSNRNIEDEPLNKDESMEIYPDMYAALNTTETYEEQPEETGIIILTSKKPSENIDSGETENVIHEIETIEPEKINEVIIGEIIEESVADLMISKNQNDSWEITVEEEDKACQTTQLEYESKDDKDVETPVVYITHDNYCTTEENQSSEVKAQEAYMSTASDEIHVEHNIYTLSKIDNECLPSSSSVIIPNQNVTLLEIDDMNFMISSDFIQTGKTILSKVEDYECIKETEGNKVIMEIGEERISIDPDQKGNLKTICDEKIFEESRESLNIHADECMPPRGELSEQESNGASDITWGKVYQEQECSSGMSTSYDLLARESWEASDCSDSEMPPLQSRIPPPTVYVPDVEPEIVTPPKKSTVIKYNCVTCGESFTCPKERRVHQTKEHGTSSSTGPKKLKIRQARKPKSEIKEENNFEVFAKVEPPETQQTEVDTVPEADVKDIKPEPVLCPMCGELCPSAKDYSKHISQVHKMLNEKNKCKTCSEVFPSEAKFSEHLKIHPLECNLCGKNFYRRYNLRIHLKRHYNIRPYKCDTCSKAFLTKQKLQEHTNVHTRIAPIKCTMCDETFRRHSNLVQHRNKHHFNIKRKYKDYVCHCGEVFHSKNKLTWHKEIHDAKPKSCTYCHEKFVHMSSLTRHIRRAHNQNYVPKGKKDTENVECHICKGVYFKSSLEVHLQTHTGRRQHACLICGKEFTTKWNLKLHRWTHASRTSKPFKCEQCNGAFIRQADYQAHMNSHKSVRPYTCNYCGCKFIRKYNCQRHVREHEESKSYTCTVCNKSFHRSYYLKEHMRVHSGARPFACHICGKTSTTKSNHNKHMKIHHAREPISTEG